MKLTLAGVLVFVWLAGVVNFPSIAGILYVLPAAAAGLVVMHMIQRRRAAIS